MKKPPKNRITAEEEIRLTKRWLKKIRPEKGWILNVETGTFPQFRNSKKLLKRFDRVFPKMGDWLASKSMKLGKPCDKTKA
jgi:hypothetical protein